MFGEGVGQQLPKTSDKSDLNAIIEGNIRELNTRAGTDKQENIFDQIIESNRATRQLTSKKEDKNEINE